MKLIVPLWLRNWKDNSIMEVFVGNPKVNVSIVAKPWSEGHVARISSVRVCGLMVPNHYSAVAL